jgi:hypothetical protein
MARTNHSPVIQTAIIQSIVSRPLTHNEIHKRVRSRVAFAGLTPTAQNTRSRTAELVHAGLIVHAGTTPAGQKLWSIA